MEFTINLTGGIFKYQLDQLASLDSVPRHDLVWIATTETKVFPLIYREVKRSFGNERIEFSELCCVTINKSIDGGWI